MTGSKSEPGLRPIPPYGAAIHDAIAGGDLQEMKAVAEAARRVMYRVEFESVTADNHAEVEDALKALELAIERAEPPSGPAS